MPDGYVITLVRTQVMEKEIIISNDWTRNWQASITVKITAIALWPTIGLMFIVAFYLLSDLEQRVKQDQIDLSDKIAYHASILWPSTDKLTFHQKLEELRRGYRKLDLPGFELSSRGEIFNIGEFKIQPSYYDLVLSTKASDEPPIEIRTFFPDPAAAATLLRNEIIGVVLISLLLFGLFLIMATHIILDKPLSVLVNAARAISEGKQEVRLDTSRQDEFGTLSGIFNEMLDNLIDKKQLEYAANTDFLTGIANRRHFDEAIEYELRRKSRTNTPLTLIMCDVDFFKQYNDLYDHIAGDLCLKHIAKALERVFNRAGDLVARYGGEEFVIILPNTNIETGIKLANTLCEEVKQLKIPHEKSSVDDYVTLSVGVATLADNEITPSSIDFIKAADKALYQAKSNGRNRVEIADSMEGKQRPEDAHYLRKVD
jgi:diguanylate cyclase (GGDEF)-like protein